MTNEEAIDILERGFNFSSTHGVNRACIAMRKATKALAENSKLKLELEDYKQSLEYMNKVVDCLNLETDKMKE